MTSHRADIILPGCPFGQKIVRLTKEDGWTKDIEDGLDAASTELLRVLASIELKEDRIDVHGSVEPLLINKSDVRKWQSEPTCESRVIWKDNYASALEQVKLEHDNNEVDLMDHIQEYIDTLPEGSDRQRSILKAVAIEKPFVIYDPDWFRQTLLIANDISTRQPYGRLWAAVFQAAYNNEQAYKEITADMLRRIALEGTKSESFFRNNCDKSMHFSLVDGGILAKSFKKTDLLFNILPEVKKKPLSWEVYVGDIESSVRFCAQYFNNIEGEPPEDLLNNRLAGQATRLSGSKDPSEGFIHWFSRTRLARMLMFMDEVNYEVNYTRLKFLKKNMFVLKKLQHFDAYLLIKTTAKDNCVFYSVFTTSNDEICTLPLSEDWMKLGNKSFCTKFLSTDRYKISRRLYTTWKIAALMQMWFHLFSHDYRRMDENKKKTTRVLAHTWVSLLIHVEDKESTSRNLQLIRYAYMEVIRGPHLKVRPDKICKKLDTRLRSRLLIWCLRKTFAAFRIMRESPPKMGMRQTKDEDEAQDQVDNLLSWIDSLPLPNFEIALNLSYMGILHNKNECNEITASLKIFQKIVEQELKVPIGSERYLLSQSTIASQLGDHAFSVPAVKSFSRDLLRTLSERKGMDDGAYQKWFTREVTAKLLAKSWEDFATTKSSSATAPVHSEHISSKRTCIENVYDLVKELNPRSSRAFLHIDELLALLESKGGVRASLFKKHKIGDTREIFILDIVSRIVINFLETVTRTLCENVDCEMLTKDDQKTKISDDHFSKVGSLKEKTIGLITVINSDDAATWAQRFIMPVFGVMLSVLVPTPFLEPCLRILNLITSKRLILPDNLIYLFNKHKHIMSINDWMMRLEKEYHFYNYPERKLVETGSKLMKNRSNMMQGILRYTSSLLHSCYMVSFCKFNTALVNSGKSKSIKAGLCTGKVSSGDSSFLLTVSHHLDKRSEALTVATVLCYLKRECYPLICARQSDEKSTVACHTLVEEFNSLWHFRNTMLMPLIKFVSKSVPTHNTDTFEIRQQISANLRAQVFEASGSTLLTATVQACQLRSHYISMGSGYHKLFPFMRMQLVSTPHPALGFFIKEPSYFAGVLGLNFALYAAVKFDDKVSRLTKKFYDSSLLSLEKEALGYAGVSLTQESITRYNNTSQMGVDYQEGLDYVNDNIEVLFRKSLTVDEILHSIAMKATAPFVSNSFQFLTDAIQHAANSYVLHTPCVTIPERTLVSDCGLMRSKINFFKCSLVKAVDLMSKITEKPLSKEDLCWLFPCKHIYDGALSTCKVFDMSAREVVTTRRKKAYVTHYISKLDSRVSASPVHVAGNKWFGFKTLYTAFTINEMWDTMCGYIPWLRDTIQDTVLNSPFHSSLTVVCYLRNLDQSSTSIRALMPCRHEATTEGMLKQIASRAFFGGKELFVEYKFGRQLTSRVTSQEDTRETAQQLQTALWFCKDLWYENNVKAYMMKKILSEAPLIVPEGDEAKEQAYSSLSYQETKLSIVQKAYAQPGVTLIPMLIASKTGLYGEFIKKATYVQSVDCYVGERVFHGFFNGKPFKLFIDGETTLQVNLKNAFRIKEFFQGFEEVLITLRASNLTREKRVGTKIIDLRNVAAGLRKHLGERTIQVGTDKNLVHPDRLETWSTNCDRSQTIRLFNNKNLVHLSVRPSPPHSPQDPLFITKENFGGNEMFYWLSNKEFPGTLASGLIRAFAEKIQSNDKDIREKGRIQSFLVWTRKTLRQRAQTLGFIRRGLTLLCEESVLSLHKDDDYIENLDADDIFDIDLCRSEDELLVADTEQPVVDFDDFWFFIADDQIGDLFKPSMVNRPPVSASISRFWDEFLFEIESGSSRITRDKAFQGCWSSIMNNDLRNLVIIYGGTIGSEIDKYSNQ